MSTYKNLKNGLVVATSITMIALGWAFVSMMRDCGSLQWSKNRLKKEGNLVATAAVNDRIYLSRGEGRPPCYLGQPKLNTSIAIGDEHSGGEWDKVLDSLRFVNLKEENKKALAQEENLAAIVNKDGICLADPNNPSIPLYYVELSTPLTNNVVAGSNIVSQAESVSMHPGRFSIFCLSSTKKGRFF